MSNFAAEVLETIELVALVFSFIDTKVITQDAASETGRSILSPAWQSCRSVNRIFKREADRIIGSKLAQNSVKTWSVVNEWPVR